MCARTRLKRRAPAWLRATATNCGPCPRPLCSAAHLPQQKARQHAPRARWSPASRARPAPRANSWDPRLGDRGATGVLISHCAAPRPPEQGRCALYRASCRGAHRAGPWAAARAGDGRLQDGNVKWPRARSAIGGSRSEQSRAGARLFNHAQAHIPVTGHNSCGGRPRPAHVAEPPGPLHLHGHFGKLPRARISLLSTLLDTVATPYSTRQNVVVWILWYFGLFFFNFDSVSYGTNYGANAFDIECFHCLSVVKNKRNL
jgi:hypothetical protein